MRALSIRGGEQKKIYYCQISMVFLPFLSLMQSLTKIEMVQILDFIFSSERIGDQSAYEAAHTRLKVILNKAGENWAQKGSVIKYARENNFNMVKVIEHLKENAFYYLHRPIEIMVMAEIKSKGQAHYIILQRTPFYELLRNANNGHSVFFYNTYVSHFFPFEKRSAYHYDNTVAYHKSKYRLSWLSLIGWIWTVLSRFAITVFMNGRAALTDKKNANIFVEILQSRIRANEVNDIFWVEDSFVSPESIYNCEMRQLDSESRKLLVSLGLKYFRLLSPSVFLKLITREKPEGDVFNIIPSFYFAFNSIKFVIQILMNSIKSTENGWLNLHLANYKFRVSYWQNIYKQLNIKIVWSMADEDPHKFAKAQALELAGGIYTGSHWSNYPFVSGINRKCYDVFFVWGDHFEKNIFNDYHYLNVFKVGYISDHYFPEQSKTASVLRNRYAGKFIISYQDNAMMNDIPYSLDMQLKMHEMLLGLLQKNENMILFLKPKRKWHFDEVLKKLSQLGELAKKDRIEIFFGETVYTKAVPAMVGMASDLVVGLGISTAAAECFFAGTVAFHADLTGFMNNEFANRGLNKIVFRDIESLEKAIQAQMDGRGISHKECLKYYELIDPFHDGKAYLRTGFIMKKLQEGLQLGMTREAAVNMAREAYDIYINENYKPVQDSSPEEVGV
mgnify:CR=1 FL=1